MPDELMNEVKREVVELKFQGWDYPSLEEAVLEFTMREGYRDIYSHVSRYKGIDCELLPRTLVRDCGDTNTIVYSPYPELIGRDINMNEDWTDVRQYMEPESDTLVSFKFIPYEGSEDDDVSVEDVFSGLPTNSSTDVSDPWSK